MLIAVFLIFLCIQFIGAAGIASAAPAADNYHTLEQPDGTQFKAKRWGDEFNHGWENKNGYTITKAADGWWVYATIRSGEIAPTTQKVTIDSPPRSISKHLRGDAQTSSQLSSDSQPTIPPDSIQKANSPEKIPTTGTVDLPVILINYSNTSTDYTVTDFDSLLFGDDPSVASGPGSMKDYYEEVSGGQLNISGGTSGVEGWYTADNSHDYYGQSYQNAAELAREAVKKSDPDVDYSEYDNNNDGMVDGVIVIHQGGGKEATGDSDDIWSHRWSFTGAGFAKYQTNDGVSVDSYTLQPETYSGQMTTIGVIAHETGHIFNMGDLYDTDGGSEGIGTWGLMGSGSWNSVNRPGDSPAHLTAYHKWYMSWVSPDKQPLTGEMGKLGPYATTHETFRWLDNPSGIERGGSGEYFLATYRYKTGFDQALPGEGVIITHIKESRYDNTNEDRKLVDIEAADGDQDLDREYNRGDAGDPYPGSTGAEGFNTTTTPNSNFYNGSSSGLEIDNILTRNNSVMLNPTTAKASSFDSVIAPDIINDGPAAGRFSVQLDKQVAANVTVDITDPFNASVGAEDIKSIELDNGTSQKGVSIDNITNNAADTVIRSTNGGKIDVKITFADGVNKTAAFNASINDADRNINDSDSVGTVFNIDTTSDTPTEAGGISSVYAENLTADGTTATGDYIVFLEEPVQANVSLNITGGNLKTNNISNIDVVNGTTRTTVNNTTLTNGNAIITTSATRAMGEIHIAVSFNRNVNTTDTFTASINSSDTNISGDDSLSKGFFVDTTNTVPTELKPKVTKNQYNAVVNGDSELTASNLANAINKWSDNGRVNGVKIGAFELSDLINFWSNK